MAEGSAGPLTFDLLVDGVALTPDSSVDPSLPTTGWQEISRTYSGIPAGDVTVLVGTASENLGGPELFGTRMRIDNISLTYETSEVIPEPLTVCALGLAIAGLGGYVRRRRRA